MSYRLHRAGFVALAVVGLVGASGCATKGFVRKEVGTLRTRVDQVATETDQANALARTSDQHAQEALQQSQVAQQLALGNVKREEVRTASVYFDFDSAQLKDDMKSELGSVVEDLRNNANYMALITGFTDATGDEEYNVGLAQRRAAAVNHFLAVELGKDFVRLVSIGFGEIQPVADNDSREGRKQNRRVEVTLVRPIPNTETASNPPTASR